MFKRIALAGNLTIALCLASTGAWGQAGEWLVRKSSGDVWVASSGAQQVALAPAASLKPGDQVRTGQNGRALLVRGDESILISPNSTIGLPKETSKGLLTTIIQERGTIVLDVEKRSEKHFEVETPYLVAVVKGTEFRVSVDGRESKVEVLSGQVEVAELKTGKFVLVSPGQVARVASNGAGGLLLSGSGAIDSIKQGTPRAPRVNPTVLPRDARANGNAVRANDNSARANGSATQALRIKSALGEVKVDFQKVTKGIARDSTAALSNNGRANGRGEAGAANSDGGNQGASNGNGLGSGGGNGSGNGLGSGGGNGSGNGGGIGGGGNSAGNGGGNASAGLGNGLGGVLGNGGCNGKGKGKGSSC